MVDYGLLLDTNRKSNLGSSTAEVTYSTTTRICFSEPLNNFYLCLYTFPLKVDVITNLARFYYNFNLTPEPQISLDQFHSTASPF